MRRRTMEREALKLALEALEEIARHATTPWEDEWCGELANKTLTAINALAQPAQRPWVGLTFDEKNNARYLSDWKTDYMAAVIEYIEAKLKEKNT